MARREQVVGRRYGFLKVLAKAGYDKHGNQFVKVKCFAPDCPGRIRTYRLYDLRREDGKAFISCGCRKREIVVSWMEREISRIPGV